MEAAPSMGWGYGSTNGRERRGLWGQLGVAGGRISFGCAQDRHSASLRYARNDRCGGRSARNDRWEAVDTWFGAGIYSFRQLFPESPPFLRQAQDRLNLVPGRKRDEGGDRGEARKIPHPGAPPVLPLYMKVLRLPISVAGLEVRLFLGATALRQVLPSGAWVMGFGVGEEWAPAFAGVGIWGKR